MRGAERSFMAVVATPLCIQASMVNKGGCGYQGVVARGFDLGGVAAVLLVSCVGISPKRKG